MLDMTNDTATENAVLAKMESERLAALRTEYVALKKSYYKEFPHKSDFDKLVKPLAERMAASKNSKLSPADWVYAARVVWNTTVPCKACGSTRCPDGCCCGC